MIYWFERVPRKGVLVRLKKTSPIMHTLDDMAAFIKAKTEELGPHTYVLQIRERRKMDVR